MRPFISKSRLTTKHDATVVTLVFLCAITATAQTAPAVRFKGHAIGEGAEEFFSTARMAESKGLAKDYCTKLLAKRRAPGFEIEGCRNVMSALQGKDATVGNRYAAGLGPGEVAFHSGKLVLLQFEVFDVHIGYTDVVADMTKKLGAPSEQGFVTYQNGFGATFQRGKAEWKSGSIAAVVEEEEAQTERVTVVDANWAVEALKQPEADRPNTLDK